MRGPTSPLAALTMLNRTLARRWQGSGSPTSRETKMGWRFGAHCGRC